MERVASIWNGLSVQQRLIMGLASLAILVSLFFLVRTASAPSMSLLYTDLDQATAGDVIAALDQSGITYQVKGAALYVPTSQRDQLRLTLASQGLPANGSAGYELLDNMSGFGTTSQMFDAAYWRAKEGELARTIMAGPAIQMARVHIAKTNAAPFQRSAKPTASVAVSARQSALTADQTRAIQFLVASATPGLLAEDVSVLDANSGRLLSNAEGENILQNGQDKAHLLQQRIERLLSARLGQGNFVVEVSVDTNSDEVQLIERIVDPASRVVISTEVEERATQSTDSGGRNAVTVASNLPEGDAGSGDRQSNSEDSSTRERINYDVSATEKRTQRGGGQIERITVAVLVDGLRFADGSGSEQWEIRPAEELAILEDLVKSAVGFSAERGDAVTIKSLELQPFDETYGTAGSAPSWAQPVDLTELLKQALLAAVVFALAFFVLRPALKQSPSKQTGTLIPPQQGMRLTAPDTNGTPALAAPMNDTETKEAESEFELPDLPALNGTIDEGDDSFELPALGTVADLSRFMKPQGDGSGPLEDEQDPVERLMQLIEDRREETVEILRGWMEDAEGDVR